MHVHAGARTRREWTRGQFTTLEYRPGGELQLPGAERARAQAPLPAERGLAQRAPLVRLNLRSLASLAGSTFWVLSDVGQTLKKIPAAFHRTPAGTEPVRDWLKALPPEDRREIGQDIATVEYGWPVGMPVCRPLGQGLWEVRSNLPGNRTARVLFCIARGQMVLLHAFVKKT